MFLDWKKKETCTAIKDITNLFRPEKQTKAIKIRIFRDIKNLFEDEEDENVYKPARVYLWSNIEYESNSDTNKALSVEEHINQIRPYLNDIKNTSSINNSK